MPVASPAPRSAAQKLISMTQNCSVGYLRQQKKTTMHARKKIGMTKSKSCPKGDGRSSGQKEPSADDRCPARHWVMADAFRSTSHFWRFRGSYK